LPACSRVTYGTVARRGSIIIILGCSTIAANSSSCCHSMPCRVYVTARCLSVCLSVRSVIRPPHAVAAGLLLWARRPGDIDPLLHDRRAASWRSAQRAVPSRKPTCEAEDRSRCIHGNKQKASRRQDSTRQRSRSCDVVRLIVDGSSKLTRNHASGRSYDTTDGT